MFSRTFAKLAAVGVKSEVVTFEWGEYLTRTGKGEHDAYLLGGSSDNGDPDNMLSFSFACDGVKGGSNRSRWCNPEFDKLLAAGRVTADPEKRAEIYQKAQAILKAEVPEAPIAHSVVSIPVRKSVLNYVMDPFGRQNFSAVDIAVTSVVAGADGTRVHPSPATEGQSFDLPSAAEQTWLLEIRTAGGGTLGHYTVRVEDPSATDN